MQSGTALSHAASCTTRERGRRLRLAKTKRLPACPLPASLRGPIALQDPRRSVAHLLPQASRPEPRGAEPTSPEALQDGRDTCSSAVPRPPRLGHHPLSSDFRGLSEQLADAHI